MRKLLIILICLGTLAAKESYMSPYPGGSPFPPGKEPKLVLTFEGFIVSNNWIDGTVLEITNAIDMPFQLEVKQIQNNGRYKYFMERIGPYWEDKETYFSKANMDPPNSEMRFVQFEGFGKVIIRFYRNLNDKRTHLPEIQLKYYKNGAVIGETKYEANPVERTGL